MRNPVFFRRDLSVVCLAIVLKLVETVFTTFSNIMAELTLICLVISKDCGR